VSDVTRQRLPTVGLRQLSESAVGAATFLILRLTDKQRAPMACSAVDVALVDGSMCRFTVEDQLAATAKNASGLLAL
jgi:hypothetical protein